MVLRSTFIEPLMSKETTMRTEQLRVAGTASGLRVRVERS